MRAGHSAVLLTAIAMAGCGKPRPPMTDGERAYRAKCSACHRLYEPGERTPEEWQDAVAKMERLKKVRLDPEEEDVILAYLAGPARAGPFPVAPAVDGDPSPAH